jgi:hypothetical protein
MMETMILKEYLLLILMKESSSFDSNLSVATSSTLICVSKLKTSAFLWTFTLLD